MQTGTLSAAQENVRVCLRFSHSRAIKWKVLQSVKGNRKSSLSFFNGNAGLHCLIRHSREKANLFFSHSKKCAKMPVWKKKENCILNKSLTRMRKPRIEFNWMSGIRKVKRALSIPFPNAHTHSHSHSFGVSYMILCVLCVSVCYHGTC